MFVTAWHAVAAFELTTVISERYTERNGQHLGRLWVTEKSPAAEPSNPAKSASLR